MLPKDAVFCGSFINNKPSLIAKKTNIIRFLINGLSLLADYPQPNRLLSIKNIHSIFDAHDFEIFDMKNVDDVYYFSAKKLN